MSDEIVQLVRQYRSKGVLVDTNILLLLVVGAFDRDRIGRFKRTRQFRTEDFDTLESLLAQFERIVTTPNILTEVSNLASQLGEPARRGCFERFARSIEVLDERYVASKEACKRGEFQFLGLADAVTMMVSHDALLVLTDDFTLAQSLGGAGVDVLNFNHIRSLFWTD